MNRFVVIVGTRPEAIKMAPLVRALRRREGAEVLLLSTGQHREMAQQALAGFGLAPDRDLAVMREDQTLPALTSRLVEGVAGVLEDWRPEAVLVQGDTTTVLASALAAFYARLPLGHVEAGLRSHDDFAPWPEEMNRRLTDSISHWCFAPTAAARQNLLREGIAGERVHVTGNTVIDALIWMRECVIRVPPPLPAGLAGFLEGRRVVLVTGHRRESFGAVFEGLCRAIRRIADEHDDVVVVYPVHLNPHVREPVFRILGAHPRIRLLDPLPYDAFVWLMAASHIVLTDSGGIQEEAPALGKPVVVMRRTSERPEGVAAGVATIAGTDAEAIRAAVAELLDDERYRARARVALPYGEGAAAERIADVLLAPR